ncbi:MAG: hypothetical protein IPJ13_07745 [Saprospiraceae bacterium]|nr:hypothetical protein [Saprospiraceae bacterium]
MKNLIFIIITFLIVSCSPEKENHTVKDEIKEFLNEQNMDVIENNTGINPSFMIKTKTAEGAKKAILEIRQVQLQHLNKIKKELESNKRSPDSIKMKYVVFENEAHKNRFIDSMKMRKTNSAVFQRSNEKVKQLKEEYNLEIKKILKKYENQ